LLHDAAWDDDWERWLAFVGAEQIPARRGPVFSLYSVALQSALDGDGVLMGRIALIQKQLEDGELVKPFESDAPGKKLYLLIPTGRDLPSSHLELAHCLRNYQAL
jgi:LysR family glycine cleavage system transcriptional activator